MSFVGENDFSVNDDEKPRKKVKFNDAGTRIIYFEPEHDGNNENSSMEKDSETVSTEFPSVQKGFIPAEESEKAEDSDVKGATNFLPECCDNKFELALCNKQVTTTGDSSKVDCCIQSDQKSNNSVISGSLSIEHYANNNLHVMDLDRLIYKTEHMTLSTSEQAEEVDELVSSSKQVMEAIILHIIQ